MASIGFSRMPLPTSVTVGAPVACEAMVEKTVSVEGTFTATYQIEISLDPANPPAASSWTAKGAALTAAGSLYVQEPCAWVRANCTAYTSGTPSGKVAGVVHY